MPNKRIYEDRTLTQKEMSKRYADNNRFECTLCKKFLHINNKWAHLKTNKHKLKEYAYLSKTQIPITFVVEVNQNV